MREMDVKKKKREKRLRKGGRKRGGYPPIWKIIASPRGTAPRRFEFFSR